MRTAICGLAAAASLLLVAPELAGAAAAGTGVPQLGQDSSLVQQVRMGGGGFRGGGGGGFRGGGGGGFRGGGGFGGFRGGGFRGGGMAFRGGGFRSGMAFRGGGFRGGPRVAGFRGNRVAGFRGNRVAGFRNFRGNRVAGFRNFRGTRVAGWRGGRGGHWGWRNGRWVWIGVPLLYGASYYGGDYGCGWLYSRAIASGSSYWWSRYNDCVGY